MFPYQYLYSMHTNSCMQSVSIFYSIFNQYLQNMLPMPSKVASNKKPPKLVGVHKPCPFMSIRQIISPVHCHVTQSQILNFRSIIAISTAISSYNHQPPLHWVRLYPNNSTSMQSSSNQSALSSIPSVVGNLDIL